MTRSSDLVMVERELDQPSIATKQESCPESAPRSETAVREILLHEALVEAAKALCKHTPLFIDGFGGARLYSEELRDVWRKQAIAAAECVIRAYLDACTKSAPGFKASHNTGERDPSVMPDCPGADTTSDGGEPMPERTQARLAGSDDGLGPMQAIPRTPGDCSGPSDTQLTKTPSADHDAGNLRGLAESNHHQPHAVSQGWRDDLENAKDGTKVDVWVNPSKGALSGAGGARVPDCWFSEGKWWLYDETKYATDSANCRSEVWGVTHWMPLPAPPSPENTPRDSSESTTGGAS